MHERASVHGSVGCAVTGALHERGLECGPSSPSLIVTEGLEASFGICPIVETEPEEVVAAFVEVLDGLGYCWGLIEH